MTIMYKTQKPSNINCGPNISPSDPFGVENIA